MRGRSLRYCCRTFLLLGALFACGRAQASLTVLLGEPFGSFGTMMPAGHISLYLDRVCADGPVKLRMCLADEPQGVVLGRLNAIGELDWIDSPIMAFLYGVDDPNQILSFATPEQVEALQRSYRSTHLLAWFPDGMEKEKHHKEWWESVGSAYIRRTWGYQIATTREQDERFVARMNTAANRHAYHLHRTNCADFVADAVNFYYPGTVRANKVADFDLMTPKQVARSVEAYGEAHPEAKLRVYEVPQVPGTLRRSRPMRGSAEMLLKTKRYLATLIVIQPEAVLAMLGMYLYDGRWTIGRDAEVVGPDAFWNGIPAVIATK